MKIKPKKQKIKAKCGRCQRRAQLEHACLTCERLVEAGKAETVYKVHACYVHQIEVLAQIKSHALVAHPVNILGATVAALKGEDVF